MKYILLSLLVAGNANAMEIIAASTATKASLPSGTISCMTSGTTKSLNQKTLKNFSKAFQLLGTALWVKSCIERPLESCVAYGIEGGVRSSYPKLNSWIQSQMSGDIKTLAETRKSLQAKISSSFFPTAIEKSELATIDHILSRTISNPLAIIAHGSKDLADEAIKSISGERRSYEMQKVVDPTIVPSINTLELFRAGQIYTERFHVEPQWHMITTPAAGTYDIIAETVGEVCADLDISKFISEDAFVSEVVNRVEILKDAGLFSNKNEINGPSAAQRACDNAIKVITKINEITKRFQQRMKISLLWKLFLKVDHALDPFIRFTPLEQNLREASFNRRPHLGHKLEVLYGDNIQAFFTLATDCLLYVKSEIGSNLKKVASVIEATDMFTDALDKATDKIYSEKKGTVLYVKNQ